MDSWLPNRGILYLVMWPISKGLGLPIDPGRSLIISSVVPPFPLFPSCMLSHFTIASRPTEPYRPKAGLILFF